MPNLPLAEKWRRDLSTLEQRLFLIHTNRIVGVDTGEGHADGSNARILEDFGFVFAGEEKGCGHGGSWH